MEQPINDEPLKVQIKNNNKILVDASLESTHTKGNLELAEPLKNISAKLTLPDGNFTSIGLRKDGNNYSCDFKVGNDHYSKNIIVIVIPGNDATCQYRITVLNQLQEVA
jgi:hypothetical protein